ncbi:MAG: preprotein translocase subunit SecE [Planctomycetota bacterium]|nr:preprotein translocase subunit SecE [Planctomycetota bacterium]
MSRDIAGTNNDSPLTRELFSAGVYKPNQGRIVRQLTCLAIWIIVSLACWALYSSLRGTDMGSGVASGIPTVLVALGVWTGFRLVNWPRFADFLIAVEAEMNKVTWPGKDELVRAAFVVIFTIFFLAISLFVFDFIWQFVFSTIGVTM